MSTRPATPTLAQLLHLVDRALSGRLLPAEAQLLRDALTRGDQAARSLGGTTAAQRRAQGALEDAERAVVALRTRYAPLTPQDAACPRCEAVAGARCIGAGIPLRQPHAVRVRAIGSITADRAVKR